MNATPPNAGKALSAEDLSKQIDSLRADLSNLVSTLTNDVTDGLNVAGRQISQTSQDARDSATNTILQHPLAAVGIAAGLGVLLGLMARKG